MLSLRTITLSALCALAACDTPPPPAPQPEPAVSEIAAQSPYVRALEPEPAVSETAARSHYVRALELESAGRLVDAWAEIDKALAAGAGRDAALLAVKLAILRNDLDTAAKLLAPLAATGDTLVHFNLGLVAEQRGQFNEARAAYLAAVEADPTYAPARFRLAILSADAGVQIEAQHHARKFIELSPDDPHAAELRTRVGLVDDTAPPDPLTGLRDPFGPRDAKKPGYGLKNPFDDGKTPDSGLKDPFAKPSPKNDDTLRPKNPFEKRKPKPAKPQDLEPLDPFAARK